jgi:hypothetical protein
MFNNMSWFATIIFYNITSIGEVKGPRGSVFTTFEELEFVAVRFSFSRRRKNEERSKQSIENLSETSSQKSEKSRSG